MTMPAVHVALLSLLLASSASTQELPASIPPAAETNVAIEALFSMGIRLQALLFDASFQNDRNFLISPLSATTAIAELMLGAEGVFLQELFDLLSLPQPSGSNRVTFYSQTRRNISTRVPFKALHFQLRQLLRTLNNNTSSNRSFVVETPSILFHDNKQSLRLDFLVPLEKFYEALTVPLEFLRDPVGAQTVINRWAEKFTHGLVKSFLETAPSVDTAAIFANIIYFKGDWEMPFSYRLNANGSFHVNNSTTVPVTYMIREMEELLYVEDQSLKCKMIALPYKNNELYMYIILPTDPDYDVRNFARRLKAKHVLSLMQRLKVYEVSVKLPKVSVSTTLRLLEPLKKYSAFKKSEQKGGQKLSSLDEIENRLEDYSKFNPDRSSGEIWLNKASTSGPLRVSDIVQQVRLTIDEKGTEAAAISATYTDYFGGSLEFYVDRPFSFFIRHEATSAVLFWGTIVDPTKSE